MSVALESGLDPEEILNSSLEILYDYQPITLASTGSVFTYTLKSSFADHSSEALQTVTLRTPDTDASNWSLHASSVWASSKYLADNLDDLHLKDHISRRRSGNKNDKVRVLELGAGAGLPGIVIAKSYPEIHVTISDYPDEQLIRTISGNIENNRVSANCYAKAYAWGSGPVVLLGDHSDSSSNLFDRTLRRTSDSRAHLVVGLHTGRYTLQSFMDAVLQVGLVIVSLEERERSGTIKREWDVTRAEHEDEKERRRWLLWIELKWPDSIL
ncbi:hypothetical protein BDP27DRAFT_1319138 [Rhodocollybia butyracea]|uniref:Nicotinamide N-methyltransferase n=1 Tax=Rhodocollybia butyracea TaxID=206335 RepID=A0A9P5Q1Z1_9AGAR|nr:hypothetical protein BDP27DRAFT_1319138 [Rhodocollybia butyracea]